MQYDLNMCLEKLASDLSKNNIFYRNVIPHSPNGYIFCDLAFLVLGQNEKTLDNPVWIEYENIENISDVNLTNGIDIDDKEYFHYLDTKEIIEDAVIVDKELKKYHNFLSTIDFIKDERSFIDDNNKLHLNPQHIYATISTILEYNNLPFINRDDPYSLLTLDLATYKQAFSLGVHLFLEDTNLLFKDLAQAISLDLNENKESAFEKLKNCFIQADIIILDKMSYINVENYRKALRSNDDDIAYLHFKIEESSINFYVTHITFKTEKIFHGFTLINDDLFKDHLYQEELENFFEVSDFVPTKIDLIKV